MRSANDIPSTAGATTGYSALNRAYPRSWWTIAWSSDVKPREVVPARLLERDVVLWRDSSGTLHCMAAHCPHLGAHLGTGGTVVNDQLQCPFHGWRYGTDGALAGVNGPDRVRKGICLPRYQIMERHGAVFLWNGADEPDIEFPDILGDLGLTEDQVVFCKHRWFFPYAAKHFAENNADGSHFAITHDTGGWAESVIIEDSPTVLRVENRVHDAPGWWTWQNLAKRTRKREITNFFSPVTGDLTNHCYGATLFQIHLTGRNSIFGSTLLCMTPVDENSFCMMDMMLMPRIKLPVVGPVLQRALDFGVGALNWGITRQDSPLMLRRQEPANPPYAPSDRATIAFRRLWDRRVDSDEPLDGPSVRHNGRRAGIRVTGKSEQAESEQSNGTGPQAPLTAPATVQVLR
ncbi:aromatic ring-hydroxylating oxygenase subunit alpha [Mycolicibacterium moriokaense]|uniref:Rieske domain-containing protein n=1 Tax=Mycolicibacterium moriokaense TaxID=39691 RepID=A0AAD1HA40_9MYCO|nr:aromatic ring-hydroxylating dioxygenase subunit alpha [Mycolicibacterium moriokaense]MCV7039193.1 aromatic ring-hydroxylating dioxygenase subunit alpha [Mycolicibacterium moriokaense]BBX00098.1 hypothetical protein MMOR_10340 [Mycolicibacterium moriokaense]